MIISQPLNSKLKNMANYKTIAPVEGITGKLNKKDTTVFRQKFARDSNGAVICPMKKEVYVV